MTLNDATTKGKVLGSVYWLSRNGWITRKIFCEWFQHFLKSIPRVRPIIFLLVGHSVIRMAAKEKIILCTLIRTVLLIQEELYLDTTFVRCSQKPSTSHFSYQT